MKINLISKSNVVTLDYATRMRRLYGWLICVSFGMGTDSVAVLVEMHKRGIKPDQIVFAHVGNEWPETNAYREVIEDWLEEIGWLDVWTVVKRGQTTNERGSYSTLFQNCITNKTMPSLAFGGRKGCSNAWKVDPIQKMQRNWPAAQECWQNGGRIVQIIGYDGGPKDCKRGFSPAAKKDDGRYVYCYPLRDFGMDRAACIAPIDGAGLPQPGKSACMFCPAMKPDELRRQAQLYPDRAREIIWLEANAYENNEKIDGLWGTPTRGCRGAEAKPGSMTEFLVGEELLPEFVGQQLVDPWWVDVPEKGYKGDLPAPLDPRDAWLLSKPVYNVLAAWQDTHRRHLVGEGFTLGQADQILAINLESDMAMINSNIRLAA